MAYYFGIIGGKDDVWGVRIPDLLGCHGGGPTPEAAIADAISAASEWAADLTGEGYPIKAPRDWQSIVADPEAFFDAKTECMVFIPLIVEQRRQVKANISLDAGQLEAIDEEAKRRGLTRSTFMVSAALDKITQAGLEPLPAKKAAPVPKKRAKSKTLVDA